MLLKVVLDSHTTLGASQTQQKSVAPAAVLDPERMTSTFFFVFFASPICTEGEYSGAATFFLPEIGPGCE